MTCIDERIYFSTERCIVRDMLQEDVLARCSWGAYDNPLLHYYDLGMITEKRSIRLYRYWKNMSRLWFAIEERTDGILLGLMSLRDINVRKKEARLGIVLHPDYTNMGIGTEVLDGFLGYYFRDMNHRVLHLDVARFNVRAQRCYHKVGFVTHGEFLKEYPGDIERVFRADKTMEPGFVCVHGRVLCVYDDMSIMRDDWEQRN